MNYSKEALKALNHFRANSTTFQEAMTENVIVKTKGEEGIEREVLPFAVVYYVKKDAWRIKGDGDVVLLDEYNISENDSNWGVYHFVNSFENEKEAQSYIDDVDFCFLLEKDDYFSDYVSDNNLL